VIGLEFFNDTRMTSLLDHARPVVHDRFLFPWIEEKDEDEVIRIGRLTWPKIKRVKPIVALLK
jgi:hypothetical protein